MTRILLALLASSFVFLAAPIGAADAEAGKASYNTFCTTCHGTTGKGDGPAGAALTPPPRDFSIGEFKYDADKNGTAGEDADLTLVIKNGAAAYGGNPVMAPWGHLDDAALANLVAFIRTLKE
ncbi:MAG: cytochrome c [bacterium]|nr:cytochrome c [bacterium]